MPSTTKTKATAPLAEALAAAFELSMYKLTLIGSHLPKTAEGLTPPQLKLLTVLAFADAPLTMTTAASRVGVAPGTLTDGVKRLVKAGLVTRQRAPADDRVVELSLSAAGRKVMAEIRQHRIDFFRQVCDLLDPEACRQLLAAHEVVAESYTRVIQHKTGGSV